MDHLPRQRAWQFSLGSFLLMVLLLGLLAGIVGPKLAHAWRAWQLPTAPNPMDVPPARPDDRMKSDGYFESGETPLY